MSRTYAIAMIRPRQKFGFKEPLARKIPRGAMGWALLIMLVWIGLAATYVVQVTQSAPRGDQLQKLENKIDSLERDVTALEDNIARGSSMYTLTERAKNLGFVAVEKPEYINPASHAYAMR